MTHGSPSPFAAPFREFFMEGALEAGRFNARWNAGESGGPPCQVGELIDLLPGLSRQEAAEEVLSLSLRDSPNHGRADLREHVARLHPGLRAENVLITTGTSEALFLLFQVLQPRKVALILPGFQLLSELALASRCQLVSLEMRWTETAVPLAPFEEWLETLRAEQPDLILFNHPHNPSGWVPTLEQLKRLQECADEWGARVVGDEHYRFLCPPHEPDPQLGGTLARNDGRSVITGSFIKCLGTPGLRIGWCVGPSSLISSLQNLKNYTTHTVNPWSEWLSEHLLRDPTLPAFKPLREVWLQNRELLLEWIRAGAGSHWLVEPPAGGWVTCLALHPLVPPEATLRIQETLQRRGVFVLDLELMEFSRFCKSPLLNKGRGFRLGLGLQPDSFSQLLQQLNESVR